MKRAGFMTEQIIVLPREHVAGAAPAGLIRRHSVSTQMLYSWKKHYRELRVIDVNQLNGAQRRACAPEAPRR